MIGIYEAYISCYVKDRNTKDIQYIHSREWRSHAQGKHPTHIRYLAHRKGETRGKNEHKNNNKREVRNLEGINKRKKSQTSPI